MKNLSRSLIIKKLEKEIFQLKKINEEIEGIEFRWREIRMMNEYINLYESIIQILETDKKFMCSCGKITTIKRLK